MSKRTLSGEILTEVILETFRFNGALLEVGNRITKPYELTSARWQVMGAIEFNQSITVAKIARLRGLNRQGVQRIVNDLEIMGMVILSENPDHKRAKLVSLSKKGLKIMQKVNKAQAVWVNQLAKKLGDAKMKETLGLLQRIRELLEEQSSSS